MNRIHYYIISALTALLTLNPSPAHAQKNKKKVKEPVLTEAEILLNAKVEEMTYATQKVVFVDSVVVDRQQLPALLKIPSEAGSFRPATDISATCQGMAFVNEMGNKAYLVNRDSMLCSSDLIDGQWTEPSMLEGLETLGEKTVFANPFVMADGTTLYFAAKSDEGIGGFDLYVTRYSADYNKFLNPELVGMPFSSTSNDILYIVDEYDRLAWFATDRNQPDGKVCIYTFVPTELRETYDASIDFEQLSSYARLDAISATWGDGTEREKALQRLQSAISRSEGEEKSSASRLSFVINDNVVYHSPSQFRAEGNASRFNALCEMKTRIGKINTQLDTDRTYYAKANESDRATLRQEILTLESELEKLQKESNNLEKEIRNAENKETLR